MKMDINKKLEEYDSSYREIGPKYGHTNRFDYKRLNKKDKRHRKLIFNLNDLRMQVPFLRILFSDYKMKWEKSQRRRSARYTKVAIAESDYLSDTSNGTVTSNIAFGYPNSEIDDHINIEPDTEPYRTGYYLLLSYEKGGWTYPEVKNYFWQKHGVRCFRSKIVNDALKGTNNFKALVKFRNRKALYDVCRILAKERM